MKTGKTYFISDLHLGADYITDKKEHEKKIVSWLRSIRTDCSRLFLVGDILDYWWEYRNVVPRGFVRFFGELADMSDSGIEINWLIGNHDIWIFDYIPRELGINVVDGSMSLTIDDKKFFISHGDGFGIQSFGFRFIRSLFRNKICQKLYASVHPRLTIPLAHKWSSSNRVHRESCSKCSHESILSPLLAWAEQYVCINPDTDYVIVGHYHTILKKHISRNCELIVLGDWIDKFAYAVFDGNSVSIEKYN